MMRPKTTKGKSPRRPMTKEVFPYEMEHKKVTGTIVRKPITQNSSKRKEKLNSDLSKDMVAKGKTVKATPKTVSKKAPLKAKENLSSNRIRNKNKNNSKSSSGKKSKKSEVTQRIAAISIQRWWRGIMEERERLRYKLVMARQALFELKKKRINSGQSILHSPEKQKEVDLSVANVDSPSNKNIIDIQSSDKKNNEVMQTASFGQLNLDIENAKEQR